MLYRFKDIRGGALKCEFGNLLSVTDSTFYFFVQLHIYQLHSFSAAKFFKGNPTVVTICSKVILKHRVWILK